MPGEIDTLRIKIESNSDKARQNIQYLVSALGELRRISGPTASELHAVNSELREMIGNLKGIKGVRDPFTNFSRGAEKAAQKAHDLGNAMRKARGEAEGMQKMEIVPIKSAPLDTFVAQIHEAHDTFRSFRDEWEAFRASMQGALPSGGGGRVLLEDFNTRDNNIINGQASEFTFQYPAVISQTNAGLQQTESFLAGIKESLAAIGSLALDAARKLGSGLVAGLSKVGSLLASGVVAGIRAVGNAASRAIGKVTGFFRSIVRIAKYRAIRAALRAITQGLSTGIENLYHFSEAYNTSFAPTMDRLSSSMLYLKNAFGAMFSPLIEYFAPYIEAFVDKLVDAFNWLQKLFAQLTGKATWYKAVKVQKKYKESTEDTAKSVKALKEELRLMDFDELNNITESPDNSSPAAKKAKEEPDPTTMFTIEETPNPMEGSLWENIKKKFYEWLGKNGWLNEDGTINWGAIGESIGTKIREWLEGIDWTGIWNTIKEIASALAELAEGILRGLFPKLFAALDYYNERERVNQEAEESGRTHAAEARSTDRALGDLIDYALKMFDGSYESYNSANTILNDVSRGLNTRMKDLYTDPRTGADRSALYEELYAKRDTLAGSTMYLDQMRVDKDFEAYSNYREQIERLSDAYTTLNEKMDEAVNPTSESAGGGFAKSIVDFFDRAAESILNPTKTWAESIRDNLDTIEESGALAGTTAGKWFGTSSRDETMKNISETMSAAQSMLSNNPLTAILQIRTRLINTLNENGQGADGLPRNRSALGKVKDSLLPGGITNVWSNIRKVLGFADGGYPTVGTMFYAGEAGAEMVGNINGRTGVASGQEITGIGDAVWSTGNTTANILNEILIAVREKDLTISPSASLGKVVARSQRLYATQTG